MEVDHLFSPWFRAPVIPESSANAAPLGRRPRTRGSLPTDRLAAMDADGPGIGHERASVTRVRSNRAVRPSPRPNPGPIPELTKGAVLPLRGRGVSRQPPPTGGATSWL